MRLPRLCAGDSPAAVLRAARRLMAEARRAAELGDRAETGRLLAEASSTGAYLLPGGPLCYGDAKTNPENVCKAALLWRSDPVELAEARIRRELAFQDLRRMSPEECELAPLTAEAELEECYRLAELADAIATERRAEADRLNNLHDRNAWRARSRATKPKRRSSKAAGDYAAAGLPAPENLAERLEDAEEAIA